MGSDIFLDILIVSFSLLIITAIIAIIIEIIKDFNSKSNRKYFIYIVENMNYHFTYKDIVYASSMRDAEKKIRRRFKPKKFVIRFIKLLKG